MNRSELTKLWNEAVWIPQPGPQLEAFLSPADVLLYGGAAGGGKTSLAIGLALTQHRRTLFVRKEGVQLTPVVDEIAGLLGHRDGYSAQGSDGRIWRMKDRQIQFGGIPNPGDETKYQGNPRDLLVIDEAANTRESQARFLMGWVRSADPNQRCRTLMCSNPPASAEGEWLITYFAPWLDPSHPNPAKPGEIRWFAVLDGCDHEVESGDPISHNGETIYPQSRSFIPSKVSDNKFYRDSGYVATLQALPEPLRSQMLLGDFRAGREDDDWQVCPSAWVQAAMDRWESLDIRPKMDAMGVDPARGGQDETVIARRHGLWTDEPIVIPGRDTPDGRVVVGHLIQHQRNAATIYVDGIGIGSSVVDFATEANLDVQSLIGSASPTRVDKSGTLVFRNLRAQLWWNFRELIDPAAQIPICLPPSKKLKADLCAPRFTHSSGKIVIESKEQLMKRLGRSPDSGDAYVYAYAETDQELTGMVALNKAITHRKRGREKFASFGWSDPIPYR